MPSLFSRLITGILFAVMMGCSFGKIAKLRDGTTLKEQNFTTTIPFVTKSRLQVVTVYVEGVPLEFIWDTGASYTILTREGAEKINVPEVGSSSVRDSRGTVKKTPLVLIPEVKLGDLHFLDVLAAIIDYPENSAVRCVGYDGILGQNAIRRAQWTSDYTTELFTVTDRPIEIKPGDKVTSFTQNQRPLVSLKVGDKTISNILLDTGSGGSVDLPSHTLQKLPDSLFKNAPVTYIDGTSQGVFGSSLDTTKERMPIDFGIGSVSVPPSLISFESKEKGKIGQQILRLWDKVSVDHRNQKLIFHGEPHKAPAPRSFWMGLSKEGQTITVGSQLIEHPNYTMGLRRGDTLVSTDGVPLPHFENYCDFYNWQMSFLRGDQDTLKVETSAGSTYSLIKALPLYPQ